MKLKHTLVVVGALSLGGEGATGQFPRRGGTVGVVGRPSPARVLDRIFERL